MNNLRFRLACTIDNIKSCFLFLKCLPGYFKLHQNYMYEPDTYDFIIQNYESVLCNRTKTMSKPTYHWRNVIQELDRWYEEAYEEQTNYKEKKCQLKKRKNN